MVSDKSDLIETVELVAFIFGISVEIIVIFSGTLSRIAGCLAAKNNLNKNFLKSSLTWIECCIPFDWIQIK